MNHSFERLLDGMSNTLRKEIIPQLSGEYARGQAYGVIYMLNSLRLRASWSTQFYRPQLEMLRALNLELQPLLERHAAPALPDLALSDAAGAVDLQACVDLGNAQVCALLDWLAAQQGVLPEAQWQAIEAAIKRYMGEQVAWEIKTTAKPMFAQISKGEE